MKLKQWYGLADGVIGWALAGIALYGTFHIWGWQPLIGACTILAILCWMSSYENSK